MSEERGPWYLLTGFLLGAVLGLFYAWVISPVEYVDTPPSSLRVDFKDQYRALIAAAFVANADLARAQARLALLGDGNVARALAEQAQRTMAEGRSPQEAQSLALLALKLGQGPNPVFTSSPTKEASPSATPGTELSTLTVTPAQTLAADITQDTQNTPQTTGVMQTPEPVRTPISTATPLPTRTPTPTPGAPFVLRDQTFICDPNLSAASIQVLAEDAVGQPVPGVEVVVIWEGGEDHFFTGLKPELGLGYTDFTMMPGVVYTLRMADGGQPVPDLTPAECETEGGTRYWGSWLLVFVQP